MAEIEFKRDYGYSQGSPFWLVWNEDGRPPMHKHASRDEAEEEAARLSVEHPGRRFHVLACMSTISTSPKVVGQRFDPARARAIEEEPAPAPAFVADEEVL